MCTPELDVKFTPDEKLWTQPSLTCIVRPNSKFSLQNCYEDNRKETKVSNADALSHTRLWGTCMAIKILGKLCFVVPMQIEWTEVPCNKICNRQQKQELPSFYCKSFTNSAASFCCSYNPSQSPQQCLAQCWADIRFFRYSSISVIRLFVIHWFWLWFFFEEIHL
jgi:hypothetical protein